MRNPPWDAPAWDEPGLEEGEEEYDVEQSVELLDSTEGDSVVVVSTEVSRLTGLWPRLSSLSLPP